MRALVCGAALVGGWVVGGCGLVSPPPDAGVADGGTVVVLADFDRRCADDDDCLYVRAGDVCECACEGGAVNDGERRAWLAAYDRARGNCEEEPDCDDACPDAFVWCEAGTCRARTGPGACGCAAGEVCVQRYDGACRGGGLQCVRGPAECAADPREPIARRVCEPGCDLVVCGDALSACGGAGGTCGARAPTPEHPAAMQCHGF